MLPQPGRLVVCGRAKDLGRRKAQGHRHALGAESSQPEKVWAFPLLPSEQSYAGPVDVLCLLRNADVLTLQVISTATEVR